MLTTIVWLKNKSEATRLLDYLETKGISRQSVRATIRHDQRMARELLGTALVEMREVETHQAVTHQAKKHTSEHRNGGGLL